MLCCKFSTGGFQDTCNVTIFIELISFIRHIEYRFAYWVMLTNIIMTFKFLGKTNPNPVHELSNFLFRLDIDLIS